MQEIAFEVPLEPLVVPPLFVGGDSSPFEEGPDDPEDDVLPVPVDVPLHATSAAVTKAKEGEAYRMA